MGDLLAIGSDWLEEKRSRHLTRTVTYERGNDSVEVAATIGRTEFEIEDATGVLQKAISRDFLVTAADLVLGGNTVLPERGDRIRESEGGVAYVHEVLAPGGAPHWRYSDPGRRTLRIHTKQVEVV